MFFLNESNIISIHFPLHCLQDKAFIRSVLQPRENPYSLLQVRDLNRLQGVIFKSEVRCPSLPNDIGASFSVSVSFSYFTIRFFRIDGFCSVFYLIELVPENPLHCS